MQKIISISVAFVIACATVLLFNAVRPPDDFVYVVTSNLLTRDSSIRWLDLAYPGTSATLLTLPDKSNLYAVDVFPAEELELLSDNIQSGGFPRTTLESLQFSQTIERVWLLDSNSLLVLTRNEVCSMSLEGCFGFFEFLRFYPFRNQLDSILKVSYRNPEYFNSRTSCLGDRRNNVTDISINPTLDILTFVIRPFSECTYQPQSRLVFVDYRSSTVIHTISMGDSLAWSPDGQSATYVVRGDCPSQICSARLYSVALNDLCRPRLLMEGVMRDTADQFTIWLDSHTVLFQWVGYPNADSEAGASYFSFDLNETSPIELGLRHTIQQNGMFRLDNDSEQRIYGGDRNMLSEYDVASSNQYDVGQIGRFNYYNNRHNQEIYFALTFDSVIRLNRQFEIEMIDLSPYLDSIPNENPFFISSGNLR